MKKIALKYTSSLSKFNFKFSKANFTEIKLRVDRPIPLLDSYQPNSEILKYYKKYENKEMNYQELESLKSSKLEEIKNKSKEKSNLDLRNELQEVIKVINSKLSIPKNRNVNEISELYFNNADKMEKPFILFVISKYLYECETGKDDYFNSDIHKNLVVPFAACVEVVQNVNLLNEEFSVDQTNSEDQFLSVKLFGIRNIAVPFAIYEKVDHLLTSLGRTDLSDTINGIIFGKSASQFSPKFKIKDVNDTESAFKNFVLRTFYSNPCTTALGFKGVSEIHNLTSEKNRNVIHLGVNASLGKYLTDKPNVESEVFTNIFTKDKNLLRLEVMGLDHILQALRILESPYFKNNETKKVLNGWLTQNIKF